MKPFLAFIVILLAAPAYGQKTRMEWRFDRPDSLTGWSPNADVKDVRIADGALQCRCAGPDPILEYRPLIDVPTAPWQAVETEMKADRDGQCVLFWSNTTQSRYGGFFPEKNTTFPVQGDSKWHTYRVFPFWHKEGRVIRFRFDPYDGASFAIRAIRIVDYTPASESRHGPVFDFSKGSDGWLALDRSTIDAAESGIRANLAAPGGFIAGPPVDIDAEANMVVSVRLSSRTNHASLLFATADSYGLHEQPITLVPDGRVHTYNLDMLANPEWRGRIVALALRPGERAGDSCSIRRLAIGTKPEGPPDLRVLWFGVEEARPRVGAPFTLSARVTNVGGSSATRVRANLRLMDPDGLTLHTASSGAANIAWGRETEYRWRVTCSRAVTAGFALSLSAANSVAVRATTTAHVGPRIHVQAPGRLPATHPVRGRYQVGVYYFPGWKSWSQWAPIARFPERKPVLGWYREGDPRVAEWQIKWAAEHGITFFAYDWYWSAGSRQLEHALLDGFLHARNRSAMQFCLLWANHNPAGTSSRQDLLDVTRYWLEHYFRQPEYLRIDGKPVVIIFSPYRFREDMGSAAVRAAFDAMRAECRKAGLPGIYLIACVGGTGDAKQSEQEGYDAITCYNWAYLNVPSGVKRAPFETMAKGYLHNWEHLAAEIRIPQMLPLTGGWDNRPWAGDTALVRYGRTPAAFKRHLQDGLRFLESHPDKTLPIALVEAWNEFGEGSYIEPHREFGFGYLDAIRDVFVGRGETANRQDAKNAKSGRRIAHLDVTPADCGVAPPEVERYLPSQREWEFGKGSVGWDSGMNLDGPTAESGALTALTTGDDPAFFGPPMEIPAESVREVRVRMKMATADGKPFEDIVQIFWATRTSPTSEAASLKLPAFTDGRWHEYVFPVATNPRWRGLITQLRLDPCNRSGVTVSVSGIRLVR